MTPLKDYAARADLAREQAQAAASIAAEVQARMSQLRLADPEHDAASRVAQLYRDIEITMLDLAETFDLYASQQVRTAVA